MKDYQKLLDYYKKCFSLVDCFHYNSETSQEVFMQYLPTGGFHYTWRYRRPSY